MINVIHASLHDVPQVLENQDEHLEEDGVSQDDLEALVRGIKPTVGVTDEAQNMTEKPDFPGKWVCAQSSEAKGTNHNKHITDKLEQLSKVYTHTGDKWRALSYSKAVNALKSYHKPVSSYTVSLNHLGLPVQFRVYFSIVVHAFWYFATLLFR